MRAGYKLPKDMKSINHLLFQDDLKLYGASKDEQESLVQVIRIFSQDLMMSFGLDKCSALEMRRGGQVGSSGIGLPDDQHIGDIEKEATNTLASYNWTLNTKMKDKVTSEYIRRVKKLFRSKLNGGNVIGGCRCGTLLCGDCGQDNGGGSQHGQKN